MTSLEERRRQFQAALAEQWEYELRESPEFATLAGDDRYNDRWSDVSLSHIEQQKRELAGRLSRFRAFDTAGFSEKEKLDHRLMVRKLVEQLEGLDFREYEMPVDQMDGIHLLLPQFVSLMPFSIGKHYVDYVARLRAIPRLFEQVTELLRQGERDGLMPPRHLLDKTVEQCRAIAAPAGEANVFGRPVAGIPDAVPIAEGERLRREVLAAIDEQVRPAYDRLAGFMAEEYAPRGRREAGIWALPDGEARYRYAIRHLTTTELDPDSIHELGLEQVARVEAEQGAIARELGFSDLPAFRASLKANPVLVPRSREQIVDMYRRFIEQMEAQLPRLFGRLPTVGLEVRPVEEYREKEAAAAEYHPGTPDGSRPGVVYVNTGDHEQRSTVGIESAAYHEGVPGHHMQVSVAQALEDLPPFRRHAYYGAYTEGWALYSERLGKEIGFYEDPYSDFGRLSHELLRAVRLVVDTGVHHKRWTREQMVDYFRGHSSEDEPDLQAEVDRYIVLPAQALTYKLGELAILGLRADAQKQLGDGYDVRAFHDQILGAGALPLDVLREHVAAWIERQTNEKRGTAEPGGGGAA
jgi:uncharacterized protein (DUF885 family)